MAAVRVGKVSSGPTARIRYTMLEEFLQPGTIQLEIGVLEETMDWSAQCTRAAAPRAKRT